VRRTLPSSSVRHRAAVEQEVAQTNPFGEGGGRDARAVQHLDQRWREVPLAVERPGRRVAGRAATPPREASGRAADRVLEQHAAVRQTPSAGVVGRS
jgi:hypothetical protein